MGSKAARVLILAVALGFIALIDARLQSLGGVAVFLAAGGFAFAERPRENWKLVSLLAVLIFAIQARTDPRWCCDATPYYVYLPSVMIDGDFNFANDFAILGESRPTTSTGLIANYHSVGPALLWLPFWLLAHTYVLVGSLAGPSEYAASGYSAPYLLATAAGTGAAVAAGVVALFRALRNRFESGEATVAVALGLLASVLPYYTFVVPSVSHGAVFAATCFFVAEWIRVSEGPSLSGWVRLGGWLGVSCLLRWQSALLGLLLLPLLPRVWRRGNLEWWWPLAAGGTSILVFMPQALSWWVLFGAPWGAPAEAHGLDWRSPYFWHVLVSADRGVLTWSPVVALGAVGWMGLPRAWRGVGLGAALVFLGTTWVNGSVAVWSGGDGYGPRRFDLLIPLCVLGLGPVVRTFRRFAERRPIMLPTALLLSLVFWNGGLLRLHRNGVFVNAAPFEELATRNAAAVAQFVESSLVTVFGDRGRDIAYHMLVGRYFFYTEGLDRRIDIATSPHVTGDWTRSEEPGGRAIRLAGVAGACVRVPLHEPRNLDVFVTMRATAQDQWVSLEANGNPTRGSQLGRDWEEIPFAIPPRLLRSGENRLCFSFASANGRGVAAVVKTVELR